jgi:hypothetical protein
LVNSASATSFPPFYQERTFTAAGGLMSYEAPLADAYRGVGIYVGRVLER